MNCYCKSLKKYSECCEPIILGDQTAPTAEALMRARFSAFCVKDFDFLISSHDPQTRRFLDVEEMKKWAQEATFTGLEIIKTEESGNKSVVEFKAFYNMGGQDHVHHEISKFRKQAGEWYFREAKLKQNKE